MQSKVLRRSRTDRVLGGVVGGASEYLGIPPTVGRIITVLVAIGSFGTFLLVYFICWAVIPEE